MAFVVIFSANISSARLLLEGDFSTISGMVLTAVALMLLFRLNVAGNITMQYEPRLSRLPLGTVALTFIPVGMRLFCIVLAYALLNGLYWVMFASSLSPRLLMNAFAVYAVLQALIWSRLYLILLPIPVVLLTNAALRNLGLLTNRSAVVKAYNELMPSDPADLWMKLFPVVFLLALLLAWQGVRWERRNEQRRLLTFSGASGLLDRLRRPLTHGFNSLPDARVWFERSKSGLAVGVVFALGMAAWPLIFNVNPWYMDAFLASKIMYLGLGLAALVLGVVRDFSNSMWPLSLTGFIRTKPISDAHLAWSHIFAMTRTAFIALFVFFVLTNTVYAFFVPEWGILVSMMREGRGGLLPLFLLLEPLFWGCVAVWIGLWCSQPIVIAMAVLLAIDLPNQFTIQYSPILSGDGMELFIYGFCLFVLIRSIMLLQYAWTHTILTTRQWYVYCAVHLLLPLFLWWPGPTAFPAAAESFLLTIAFTSLLLSPLVAIPRQVAQKRALA